MIARRCKLPKNANGNEFIILFNNRKKFIAAVTGISNSRSNNSQYFVHFEAEDGKWESKWVDESTFPVEEARIALRKLIDEEFSAK